MPTKNLHVLILGNMSAGKSTLVNALLGNALMPTANEATTAKVFCLHSNEAFSDKNITVESEDYSLSGVASREAIQALNQQHSCNFITCKCKFPVLQHYGKSVYVYDTPGPNTATQLEHATIVKKIVEASVFTHIVCLLDATKLRTEEESSLLKHFAHRALQQHADIPCIFVVNKVDEIDESRETPIAETIASTREFLAQEGFAFPTVLPMMAKAAQIFRCQLRNKALTQKERRQAVFFKQLLEDRKGVLFHAASLAESHKEAIGKIMTCYAKTPSVLTSPYYPFWGPLLEQIAAFLQTETQRLISETGIRTLEILLEREIIEQ